MEVTPFVIRARQPSLYVALLVIGLSCFRLAHVHLLWADEDYHLAAAINILHGKVPYRDFWYDKPPLAALYYVLIGGRYGWPLRLWDALYITTCCYVAYRFACSWWSAAEGYVAALLIAFYTTFYLPSAVIPFAADTLMLLPHLLAVYWAFGKRPVLAGCFAGIAFLANTKAVFVLASCGLFLLPELVWLSVAFALTSAAGLALLAALGAWNGYIEQVWRWGFIYARDSPVRHAWSNGFGRTINWMGFHLLAVLAALYGCRQATHRARWQLGGWIGLSLVAVALGNRFAPHYFLQLLPALAIAGSRGIVLAFGQHRRTATALIILLLAILLLAIPLVRFGPRYVSLALNFPRHWADVAMDVDSQKVAQELEAEKHAGETLFVWGYRPDIYVYTRMSSDSRFWDSQPLTGVPADRHLSASTPIYGGPAKQNRHELASSKPDWIVDGLGLLNPKLRLDRYPDLEGWMQNYQLVHRTGLSLIYRRRH